MSFDDVDWPSLYSDPREAIYRKLPGPQKRFPRYAQLLIACDLCLSSIAQCVNRGLPLSRVYELNVHPQAVWDATCMIRDWIGRSPNPLAPVVNLIPNEKLRRSEWFLESEGYSIGSDPPW